MPQGLYPGGASSGGGGGAPSDKSYLTLNNELATLVNSKRLIAGTGISFAPGAGTLTIDGAAGSTLIHYAYQNIVGNHTVNLAVDAVLTIDAAAAARTVTLPTANGGNTGKAVVIKKIDTTANLVTVNTTGGQLIDGDSTSYAITSEDQALCFVSTGSGWIIL